MSEHHKAMPNITKSVMFLILFVGSSLAQTTIGTTIVSGWLGLQPTTVAQMLTKHPTSGTAFASVNDGISASDCAAGGGTNNVICAWNGSSWAAIGSGGGGGSATPGGGQYDVQFNNPVGTFGADTGFLQNFPDTHTLQQEIFNALTQLSVGDTTHSASVDYGHSDGTNIDAHYIESLSSTFSLSGGGYKVYKPDAPAVGCLQISSLTPDGSGFLSTYWLPCAVGTVTAVSGTTNEIDVATGTSTPVISLDGQFTSVNYATCTNTSNVITVTLTPAPTSLVNGLTVQCKASAANSSTTPTLNVNALGAHTIVKGGSSGQAALVNNDILTNMVARFTYNAATTTWELQNPQQLAAGAGTVTSVAATGDGIVLNSSVTGSPVTTTGTLALSLANASANTVFGNFTGSSAAPSYNAISACGDGTHALKWTAGTGFACQAISVGTGTVTSIATTAPLAGGTITTTGTISITGAAGQVLAGASPAFTATPALGTDGSVAGTLQLANGSAAFHTILGTQASANWTFKFPTTAGTNTYLLQTDGSGNTSWVAPSSSGLTTVTGPTGIMSWSIGGGTATQSAASVLDDVVMSGPPTGSFLTPTPTGNYCTFHGNSAANPYAQTCVLPATTASGNLLHAWVTSGYSNCTSITVADGTNTYTQLSSANNYNRTWYAKNIAGGSVTVTFTCNGNGGNSNIAGGVVEITNADTSSPVDTFTGSNPSGVGLISLGPVTTANATDIIVGSAAATQSQDTYTPTAGWTTVVNTNFPTPASGVIFIYQTASAIGTFSPQYNCTPTCNDNNSSSAYAVAYKGKSTSGASGAWSPQYFRFSQLCPIAFPGMCGLTPASTSGTTGFDLHVGSPIEATSVSSAYAGNNAASTLATTQTTNPSAYHCYIAVNCHSATATATVIPALLYTDTSNTAETITGATATCTTLGTNSTSNNEWPIYVHASSTIYLKTTLANSPTYDVHAVCSLANTK